MSNPPKSISVVVPVHNAERRLTHDVSRLLDVLPDLAEKFEVLIVDDGSTDQTEDVALELSHQFPQVRVARHAQQRGIEASAQTGAARTTGDIVIVHAGQEPVNASQLRRMWEHREDEELVVAPIGSHVGGIDAEVLRQLEDWGHGVTRERDGTPDRGDAPTDQAVPSPASKSVPAPQKAPARGPTFRFSGVNSHSPMHQ